MARLGINYADLATAADQLLLNGINPTVDNVREALGSTGSKSTIGPYLKRWKQERENLQNTNTTKLPEQLIQAVSALHLSMQESADKKILENQTKTSLTVQLLNEQLEKVSQELESEKIACNTLTEQLRLEREARKKAEALHQEAQNAYAIASNSIEGLNMRLNDHQNEVGNLHQQLNQSRLQLSHYQDAISQQRQSEKQQIDAMRERFEAELSDARTFSASIALELSQEKMKLDHTRQEKQLLQANLLSLDTKMQGLLAEQLSMSSQLTSKSEQMNELTEKFEKTSDLWRKSEVLLAIAQNDKNQFEINLAAMQKNERQLIEDNMQLRIRQAHLEGVLSLQNSSNSLMQNEPNQS